MAAETGPDRKLGWICASQGLLIFSLATAWANHLALRLASQFWFDRIGLYGVGVRSGAGPKILSPGTPSLANLSRIPLAPTPGFCRFLIVLTALVVWALIFADAWRGRLNWSVFWWCSSFLVAAAALAAFGIQSPMTAAHFQ